ncbi:MAG: 50S ribosomal protein L25/general stress protein Ctc [Victivallaceae bacterium]
MELTVTDRSVGKKSFLKMIRQKGDIPAVIYFCGQAGANIVVDGSVFKKFLSSMEPGTLSSTIFVLAYGSKVLKTIIKDIQYDITTYDVIHIDFEELVDNIPITLNIPIKCVNVMDCLGVKLGGVLRQIVYALKVICLPDHIVPYLEVDVKNLGMAQTKKLCDMVLPLTMKPITSLKEVVVTVTRR